MKTTQNILLLSALAASLQTFGCGDRPSSGSAASEIGQAKPQPKPQPDPEPKPKPTPGPKDTGDPAP